MNSSIIRKILGCVLVLEGLLLLLPCMVGLIYSEKEYKIYLIWSVITLLIGAVMVAKKNTNNVFYLKEGCIATALSWIFLSLFGAVPFYLTGEIPRFTDALFETVSGFTTTGASILNDVESLSHASLFWRSFTHWIGGMGVLVFILTVVKISGGSNVNLLKAESPGPSVGKLVPKMRYTARMLYLLYFALTVLEIIFLVAGKMPIFDAVTAALGTAGTGGFGIKGDSMASYSPYIQWVITVFMVLFGVNFNFYYFVLFKHFGKAVKMEEVRVYLLVIVSAITVISFNTYHMYNSVSNTLTHSAFQVASIITTTGYTTVDFDLWPSLSKTILVLLMFIGACAGSTGGGIKVSRIVLLLKTIKKEVQSYIHPKTVKKVRLDGKPVEHEVIRSTNVFFMTFSLIFITSLLIISAENYDLATNFSAVAATMNNIGPGLSLVGPSRNFSHFSDLSKYVFIFDMLAGRLEIFPILLLFSPNLWIDVMKKKSHKKILRG